MKKLFVLASVFVFALTMAINVKADEMPLKSVKVIMAEIRLDQGVQNNQSIDVSKVSSVTMEELGDSVMEEYIGDSVTHERIDNRLGGDGSASLSAVHTRIGYDYLRGYPINMMSFMGGGMWSNNGPYNANPQLSDFDLGELIAGIFILLIVIAGAIYFLSEMTRHKKITSIDPAVEIAKQRYARGEITKEEFEMIKSSLTKKSL